VEIRLIANNTLKQFHPIAQIRLTKLQRKQILKTLAIFGQTLNHFYSCVETIFPTRHSHVCLLFTQPRFRWLSNASEAQI